MPDHSLDEMLGQLYAADPADFVALRKQLQGELRADGMKPEAALLAKARRPTTAMWAVNQLVRQRPELVDTLLARSDDLRAAQALALAGEREAMRDAMRAHRAAVDETLTAALAVLGSRANDGFREEIAMILRAASAQPDIGRELQMGRLVRTDDSTPGFPDLGDVEPAPLPPRAEPRRARVKASAPKRPADDGKAEAERVRALAEEAERAAQEDAEREARAELERALAAAGTADEEATAAERRVEELTEELAGARRDLKAARAQSRAARTEADRARRNAGTSD